MPRNNPYRAIRERGEANLARRIEHERTSRGLSYEGLAKAMTDAGCPIQGSALFRIEKNDPPRKISVDELVALAEVFGVESVDDLLLPMELVAQREALELFERMKKAETTLMEATGELFHAAIEYLSLAQSSDELSEFMTHQIRAAMEDSRGDYREFLAGEPRTLMSPDPYESVLRAVYECAQGSVPDHG